MNEHDWLDPRHGARDRLYQMRAELIRGLMVDVRLHRAARCESYPLCPGPEAADKVNLVPDEETGDFIMTLLAAVADRDEIIDNLKATLAIRDGQLSRSREFVERGRAQLEALRRKTDPPGGESDAG